MECWESFTGLEFWLDVLSFKALENPDPLQLKTAAFNIQQKYLTSSSLKRIFPAQTIARLEIDMLLKEIDLAIAQETVRIGMFDALIRYITNNVHLGAWRSLLCKDNIEVVYRTTSALSPRGERPEVTKPAVEYNTTPAKDSNALTVLCNQLCTHAWNNDLNAVKLLLNDPDLNFFVNQYNSRGQTPLFCAARQNHVQTLCELLKIPSVEKEIDKTMQVHGGTALHGATFQGHGLITFLLLRNGASYQIPNANGLTARQEAKGDAIDVFAYIENGKMNRVVEGFQEEVNRLEADKFIMKRDNNLIADGKPAHANPKTQLVASIANMQRAGSKSLSVTASRAIVMSGVMQVHVFFFKETEKRTFPVKHEQLQLPIRDLVELVAAINVVDLKGSWIAHYEGKEAPLTGPVQEYLGQNIYVTLLPSKVRTNFARSNTTGASGKPSPTLKTSLGAKPSKFISKDQLVSAAGEKGSYPSGSATNPNLREKEKLEKEKERSEKSDKSDKVEEADSKPEKEKPEKPEKEKPEKVEKEKSEKPEKEKPEKPEKPEKTGKGKGERGERPTGIPPFRRMIKLTILGTTEKLREFLTYFKEQEHLVIGDTLVKVNPYAFTKQSRFYSKLLLSDPGLIIYTSFEDFSKYQHFQGFSGSHSYTLVVTHDDKNSSLKKKRKGTDHLHLDRAHSFQSRCDMLMTTLERIIKGRKVNIGKTLNVEFPSFIQGIMNNFVRFQQSQSNKISTPLKIMESLFESICHEKRFESVSVHDTAVFVTFVVNIYLEDASTSTCNKKLIRKEDINSPLKHVLMRYFKLEIDVLEDAAIFNKHLEFLTPESMVKEADGAIHVFLKAKSFRHLITVLERTGWILPQFTNEEKVGKSDLYLVDSDGLILLSLRIFESAGNDQQFFISHEMVGKCCENTAKKLNCSVEVLIDFLKNFEIISDALVRGARDKYFLPILASKIGTDIRQKKDLHHELKNAKDEQIHNRFFLIPKEMPFLLLDRMFSVLYQVFLANVLDFWYMPNNITLLLKQGTSSYIIICFENNCVFVKYIGLKADINFFCKMCSVIRIVFRNLYYRLEFQELLECPICKDETHSLEDIFPYFSGTKPYTCSKLRKAGDIKALVPDFYLEGNKLTKAPTYMINVKLGQGAFGLVHGGVVTGEEANAGMAVAIKTFRLNANAEISWGSFQEFLYEAKIANDLDSKYILRQVGVNLAETALVLELAPYGVLGELLHSSNAELAAPLKKKMALEMVSGLQYLHTRDPPIIHRDLRSYNVFVISTDGDADVNVKIGDFGLSTLTYIPTNEPLESWQWIAPEVISGAIFYDTPSDIYSFATVLYELFYRILPFSNIHQILHVTETPLSPEQKKPHVIEQLKRDGIEVDVENSILRRREFKSLDAKYMVCEEGLRPKIPDDGVPHELLNDLLNSCWVTDPNARPNAESLMAQLIAFQPHDIPEDFVASKKNVFMPPRRSVLPVASLTKSDTSLTLDDLAALLADDDFGGLSRTVSGFLSSLGSQTSRPEASRRSSIYFQTQQEKENKRETRRLKLISRSEQLSEEGTLIDAEELAKEREKEKEDLFDIVRQMQRRESNELYMQTFDDGTNVPPTIEDMISELLHDDGMSQSSVTNTSSSTALKNHRTTSPTRDRVERNREYENSPPRSNERILSASGSPLTPLSGLITSDNESSSRKSRSSFNKRIDPEASPSEIVKRTSKSSQTIGTRRTRTTTMDHSSKPDLAALGLDTNERQTLAEAGASVSSPRLALGLSISLDMDSSGPFSAATSPRGLDELPQLPPHPASNNSSPSNSVNLSHNRSQMSKSSPSVRALVLPPLPVPIIPNNSNSASSSLLSLSDENVQLSSSGNTASALSPRRIGRPNPNYQSGEPSVSPRAHAKSSPRLPRDKVTKADDKQSS